MCIIKDAKLGRLSLRMKDGVSKLNIKGFLENFSECRECFGRFDIGIGQYCYLLI
jgi:hypothetical protein